MVWTAFFPVMIKIWFLFADKATLLAGYFPDKVVLNLRLLNFSAVECPRTQLDNHVRL